MTSLFRDINAAAMDLCTTKNQAIVAMAMIGQTIGYGKASDPLTDKRLAQITNIRLDRLRIAINAVVKKGWFDRLPHKKFGAEYVIGKAFLEAHQGKVYTPSLPKVGRASENENPITRMGKDLPEKQTHTINNTNNTKKPFIKKQQQTTVPQAEQQSVKLFFTDMEHVPPSFAVETSSANTRIEFAFGTSETQFDPTMTRETETPAATSESIVKLRKLMMLLKANKTKKITTTPSVTNTEVPKKVTVAKKIASPQPEPLSLVDKPAEEREAWEDDALAAADYLDRKEAEDKAKEAVKQPTTTVCCDKPQSEPQVSVPSIVGEENYNACNRRLHTIPYEDQKKVLLVFNYNVKKGKINNKAGYFIRLVESAEEGGLFIPAGAIVKKAPTAASITAAKERERRIDYWSDFRWLNENAVRQGVTMEILAAQMGEEMEAAYAMFSKESGV